MGLKVLSDLVLKITVDDLDDHPAVPLALVAYGTPSSHIDPYHRPSLGQVPLLLAPPPPPWHSLPLTAFPWHLPQVPHLPRPPWV